MLFGDSFSGEFVADCPNTPNITYGDRNRQLCVNVCLSVGATAYYGDPSTRECETSCQDPTVYTADPATSLCALRCSSGTFRYNITSICITNCPSGYGDNNTRICVATCPQLSYTFGFYNSTSGYRICLLKCPSGYFAQNVTRTCVTLCPSPASTAPLTSSITYFAYNGTR